MFIVQNDSIDTNETVIIIINLLLLDRNVTIWQNFLSLKQIFLWNYLFLSIQLTNGDSTFYLYFVIDNNELKLCFLILHITLFIVNIIVSVQRGCIYIDREIVCTLLVIFCAFSDNTNDK